MVAPLMDQNAPSPQSTTSRHAPVAETLALALAGGAAGHGLRLPAGALAGAMLAVATAAILGRPMTLPDPARDLGLFIVGFAAGAALTPDIAANLLRWPVSLLALGFATAAMWIAGYGVYRRGFAWSRRDAFYAATPGALATTLALAAADGADLRRIAVAQSLRLVALSAVIPIALSLNTVPLAPAPKGSTGWAETALVLAASAAAGLVAHRLKIPAAWALGPMAASAALHGAGLTALKLSDPIVFAGYALIGALVGKAFRGANLNELARAAPAALAALAATALAAATAASAVGSILGLPLRTMLLAYAPGGLEAMVAVSLALGADTAFVAAHHVARWMGLTAFAPLAVRLFRRGRP